MLKVSDTCDVCGARAAYVTLITWNAVFLGWSFCDPHFQKGSREVRELEQAHRALAAQDVSTRMICRIISERIRRKELLPSLVED